MATLVSGSPSPPPVARPQANRRRPHSSRRPAAGATTLLLALLLALLAPTLTHQAEAKTHHSKRQASSSLPQQQQVAGPSGRESTNWWNLWWQQYISEAVQPTVRPIVGIHFGGRSISLAGEQPEVDSDEQLQQVAVGRAASRRPEQRSMDMQQAAQMSWQSARPSMFQARDLRLNRQAPVLAPGNELDLQQRPMQQVVEEQPSSQQQLQFGLQMRANVMQRPNQQVMINKASVGQATRPLTGPASNLLQQQQRQRQSQQAQQQQMVESEDQQQQQQQQQQMGDFSDEAELDMMMGERLPGGASGADDQPSPGDSSSSSMMLPQPPRAPQTTTTSTTTVPITTTTTASTVATTSSRAPAAGQQVPGMQGRPTGKTDLTGSGEQQPSTTMPMTGAGRTDVDLNETPISFGGRADSTPTTTSTTPSMSATQTTRPTQSPPPTTTTKTPAGRVELENGRPATGGRMPMATTTSARLPPIKRPEGLRTTTGGQQDDEGRQTSAATTTTGAPQTTTTTTTFASTTTPATMPTTTKRPPAGQPTSSTPAASSTAPEDASDEGSDEGSEDEPEAVGGGLLNANGTVTAEGGDEAADSDEEEEEEPEAQTSTAATTVGRGGGPQGASTSGATGGRTSVTTPQPQLTTMELERLPKGGQTAATTGAAVDEMQMATRSKPPPMTTTTTTTATGKTMGQTTGGSPAIATQTSPRPSGNLMVMRVDPSKLEGVDGAITMPMEALMRMMMMNQLGEGELERRPPQAGTTPANLTASTSGRLVEMSEPSTSSPADLASTTPAMLEATSMSTAPTGGRPEGGELVTDDRKRLQPPPTTRLPSTTTAPEQSSAGVQMDGSPAQGQTGGGSRMSMPTTVALDVAGGTDQMMSTTLDDSDGSGGREAKIELLNMDLVPIQRLMMDAGSGTQQQQQPSHPSGAPATVASQTTKQVQQVDQPGQRQQLAMMEVEPGMRLRPTQQGVQQMQMQMQQQQQRLNQLVQQQQQQQQVIGKRPQAPELMPGNAAAGTNQASTVYMIMMSSPTATTVSSQDTSTTVRRPMSASTVPRGGSSPTGSGQPQGKTSGATATTAATKTSVARGSSPTMATTTTSTITTTAMKFDRITSGQPSGGPSASPSQQLQTTMPARGSGQPASMTTVRMMLSGHQQLEQSTTTTTGRPGTLQELPATAGSARASSQSDRPRLATSAAPAATATGPEQASTATATPPPPTTSSSPIEREEQTTPPPIGVSSAPSVGDLRGQLMGASQAQRPRGPTVDSSPSSQQPAATTPQGGQLERLQQQPLATDRRPLAKTKSVGGSVKSAVAANATSSFIPSKLRNDFKPAGEQQQQRSGQLLARNQTGTMTATTTRAPQRPPQGLEGSSATTSTPSAMVQSMAIRQFGGANRMSALAQGQPVPFGRPATMMMAGKAGSTKRVEVPSFEYGPAIAVRRPDEPLAQGQVPNCTLTGKNFCVLTKDYPMNEVRQAVERSFRSVRIMYEELQTVSDQELHKEDFANATSSQAASGKFACQTQVEMMRPGWARDEISREWMLVVNTDVFPQRVRTESCAQPNSPCEFIAPFYDSTCQQRYSLHRMIAIDPHDPARSPQVAVFKFPAGCVCRVHPIRKSSSLISQMLASTTLAPTTSISSSTSTSIRR